MAAGDVTATISKPTGKALYFDGLNDYVDTSEIVINKSPEFTISIWAKVINDGNSKYLFAQNWANDGGIIMDITATDIFRLSIKNFSGDATTVYAGNMSAYFGNWANYVFVYDGSNIIAYIDSAQFGSLGNVSGYGVIGSGTKSVIGAYTNHASPMNGAMDKVRIYNRALTPEEIATIYAGKTVGKGLVGYWDFNDPTNPGKDDSGNDNNGTVVGAIEAAGHNTIEDDVKSTRVSANDVWGFIPLANNQEIMMAHIEEA